MSKGIKVTFEAGSEKFKVDLDTINQKLKGFGEAADATGKKAGEIGPHGVTSVQAVSASLRTLEGGLNNNLRAAERFIGSFRSLAGIAQAAFPAAGMLAVGGIFIGLAEHVKKAYEAFKQMQEAPSLIAAAFAPLRRSLCASRKP